MMAEKNVAKGASKRRKSSLLRMIVFMAPYKRQVFWLVVMTVTMAFIGIIPPILTRGLIDDVFTQRRTELFFPLGFLTVVVSLAYYFIQKYQSTLCLWLGQRFVFDVRHKLYSHILGLSLRFFSRNGTGKLVNRLMGDSTTVEQMLTGQSLTVLSDLIVASSATIATFVISWRLALVLLLILCAFLMNFKMNRAKLVKYGKLTRSAYDRMANGVQNRLNAELAVKTFGAEVRENNAFAGHASTTLVFGRDQSYVNNTFGMNVGLIQCVGYAILYFCGCGLVLRGDLTYGDVLAFSTYALQLLWPAVRFSNLADQLQQVNIATERLFEIFDEEPEIKNAEHPLFPKHIRGEIDFQDVHFHYDPGIEIIKGFSLHVNPGDTIALIGPTGCGKSTILNLIIRYFDITGGKLLLDGMEVKDIDLGVLRRQFGIVLQESHLFSTTIRENIRYSRPEASEEEVIAAAKAAEIHSFIADLPDGYDTPLGDFGVELSVGQKQRINIARAICSNPAILIMDEATSSLDSDSEQAIQKAMDKILQGRTSFVVAHRLSTIRNATKIILLDKGVIQECGTHDELMAIPGGRYQELYLKHMGKGVIEEEQP